MNIRETNNGKYQYNEWYVDTRTGKNRRVSVTLEKNTASARREAERILGEKIKKLNSEVEFNDITLEEAAGRYIAYQEHTCKASTYRRNKFVLKTVLDIIGPDTLLNKLTAGYINKQMLASGREKSTINEEMTRFKAFIRWCYKNDLLTDISFLDKVEHYKVDKAPEKQKYLEREELLRLLPELTIPINRLAVEFLALSGLRVGEMCALTWKDIEGKTLHVNKTYDSCNDVVTSTKTAASCRDIHIQPELTSVIQRLRKYYISTGIRSEYVFANDKGNHLNHRQLEKYFAEKTEKVLGRRLVIHSLRHTHASLLFEQGMSLDAVSLRLGHANSKITREVYLHVTEKKREEYDSQLEKIRLFG